MDSPHAVSRYESVIVTGKPMDAVNCNVVRPDALRSTKSASPILATARERHAGEEDQGEPRNHQIQQVDPRVKAHD